MSSFPKSFYIQPRFFYCGVLVIVLFIISYFVPSLFNASKLALLGLFIFLILDTIILFIGKNKIEGKRIVPEKFSNGDQNPIRIELENRYSFIIDLKIIDEIPEQFQVRNFSLSKKIKENERITLNYNLRPVERGEYFFGVLNVYASSLLGLTAKRYTFQGNEMVPTYPSYIQLRKYELMSISHHLQDYGVKKIRRIGHTMEFEQIKEYVPGDDIRTINWKASSKKNELMVNQFQDERSQSVYSVIDKSRNMKMPFNGLSLLDYAINASLVISNVVLRKQDKAGIFSFSKKVENMVVAQRRSSQMSMILESLYNLKSDFFESDYSRLYADIKRNITHHSLILLYTNFETLDSLNRQLPYLKAIAKNHLLVVIFFKNTEINSLIKNKATTIQEVYDKVISEKFVYEKKLILSEFKKHGIQAVLTSPEDLTVNTINKYLEIKSRGIL